MALKVRKGGAWVNIGSRAGGLVKATANGALSVGDPVILNSDGTVSKVESEVTSASYTELPSPNTEGSEESFTTANTWDLQFRGARIAYVHDGDYYIICYVANIEGDADKNFLRVRAATVNSTGTITYGPEYEVHSENTTTSSSTGWTP